MFWLITLFVGLLSWWGMGTWMRGNEGTGGMWASLVANLLGAYLGDLVLGDWGLMLFGYNVVAGFVGGIVVSYVWNLVKSKL